MASDLAISSVAIVTELVTGSADPAHRLDYVLSFMKISFRF